jgi:hypothetical protein
MTQADFLPWIETELHLRGEPFDRGELAAWVASMWPWIADDPDAYRWAGAFLDTRRATGYVTSPTTAFSLEDRPPLSPP